MSKPRGWGLSEGALNNLSNYSQTVLSWLQTKCMNPIYISYQSWASKCNPGRFNSCSHKWPACTRSCVSLRGSTTTNVCREWSRNASRHLIPPHTSTQIGLNSWEYAAFPLLGGSWRTKMLSDSSIRHQVSRGASKRERGGFLITCF